MESKSVSKGEMRTFACPHCGWTVKSPWGENDIMDHISLHAKNHHPDVKKSKEEITSMIR